MRWRFVGGNFDAGASVGVKAMVKRLRAQQGAEALLRSPVDFASPVALSGDLGVLSEAAGLGATLGFGGLGQGLLPSSSSSSSSSGAGAGAGAGACEDPLLLTLSQLHAATSSVLHLEAQARSQLQAKRDARLIAPLPTAAAASREEGEGEGEVVNLGAVHLLQELRLAHDDLRWRISQRNAALSACSIVLAETQAACIEAHRRIVETKTAVAEVKRRMGTSRR